MIVAIWGYFLDSVVEFWFLAWMVAIVQGGSQALSRSLYAALSPAAKSGEFFGLFGIMEKFSAIIGPLLFAAAGIIFGSSRPGRVEPDLALLLGRLPVAESECRRRQARRTNGRRRVSGRRDCRLMTNLTGAERARYVQEMFSRIARHYDLMNRVMTAGQDIRWRKAVIGLAGLPAGGWLLDLGAGTGDLAREALRQQPSGHILAADFTLEMMRVGQERSQRQPLPAGRLVWSAADATRLPFPERTFEAVVSGFLLRNVNDVPGCLAEQYRVLKPGGRLVAWIPHRPRARRWRR